MLNKSVCRMLLSGTHGSQYQCCKTSSQNYKKYKQIINSWRTNNAKSNRMCIAVKYEIYKELKTSYCSTNVYDGFNCLQNETYQRIMVMPQQI
ncbi:hypothetical protein FQR65_LT06996 [Abscondita terminalis]|nr:hypothetical protein FQR65_LT06996 [Abscondita terminalis]